MSKKQPVMSHDPLAGLSEAADTEPTASHAKTGATGDVTQTGYNDTAQDVTASAAKLLAFESSLTIAEVGALQDRILQNLRTMTPLQCDASEVDSVDAAGLQLLAAAFKTASEKGLEVSLTGASTAFANAATLIGLGSLFSIDQDDRAA